MGRLAVCVVLSFIVACSIFNLADGKCSQFGHSCFGAHGKRADEQYGALEPVEDLYPSATQLRDAEEQLAMEDVAMANPRTMAGVRNLMDMIGQLMRQRAAAQQQQQQQQQRPSPVQLGPNDAYLH
ncbi:neuropeptide CCHamide-1-like [Eriocheir sinensis]|uniref:neuropeptide CCHamide-1-like n=1 Tax=Eriocheir sinensis TaxID=95602 RepID=UPI0021C65E49|nr:neuropeptide CCHamide-1-like [Eriocheir sinensis]